jgi:hypothetical protein
MNKPPYIYKTIALLLIMVYTFVTQTTHVMAVGQLAINNASPTAVGKGLIPIPEIKEDSVDPPVVEEPRDYEEIIVEPKIPKHDAESQTGIINSYIQDICSEYSTKGHIIEPELVQSIVFHESRYKPSAKNGSCVGLTQISTYWHADRAEKLGITDFYDPYSNILLCVDFLSELFNDYDDPVLVLMLYNMKRSTAFAMYNQGRESEYARKVLAGAKQLKEGGVLQDG